ncbi:MAG: ABC transporter permease subunit [Helicobacteraceae bacterium]|jgi:phosphate transport system permease protein|nr:ABC transporter permease subunit [Helicobacteraceae bacterium]
MKDRLTLFAIKLGAIATALAAAALFAFVIAFGVSAAFSASDGAIFGFEWRPSENRFGVMAMLIDSLILSSIATVLGFGAAIAIVCNILAKNALSTALDRLVAFMSGFPTILYAFVALFVFAPILREKFGGAGLLCVVPVLILLILPTMITIMKSSLAPRLKRIETLAASLGFSPLEALFFVVLKNAKSALIAAFLLGFGRAAGDTMIALMLSGNAPQIPSDIHESFRVLSAHMALATANEAGAAAFDSLYLAGAALLLINLVLGACARLIAR